MTNKVSQLLDLAGSRIEIAAECDVEPIAVYRWSKSGSIPSKHMPGVLRVSERNRAGITADDILAAHDVPPSFGPSDAASLPDGVPPSKRLDQKSEFQGERS